MKYHNDKYIVSIATRPENTPCFGSMYSDTDSICQSCPLAKLCKEVTSVRPVEALKAKKAGPNYEPTVLKQFSAVCRKCAHPIPAETEVLWDRENGGMFHKGCTV